MLKNPDTHMFIHGIVTCVVARLGNLDTEPIHE